MINSVKGDMFVYPLFTVSESSVTRSFERVKKHKEKHFRLMKDCTIDNVISSIYRVGLCFTWCSNLPRDKLKAQKDNII